MSKSLKSEEAILYQFIESEDFANGKLSPVAYTTAQVARLKRGDTPAFPSALQWLRENQLGDGSWGAKHPFLSFDRIISTLAAIVCLKQWNDKNDLDKIEAGLKFINDNLHTIREIEQLSNSITVGFEMIFSDLVDQGKLLGIHIEQHLEGIIDLYRKDRKSRLLKYANYTKCTNNYPWFFSLEGIGCGYTEDQIRSQMAKQTGIICHSYGATAYALTRGIDSVNSWDSLTQAVITNGGGVPPSPKYDTFDICWSLMYLHWVGIDIKDYRLSKHLNRLHDEWRRREGGLMSGNMGPDGLPIDSDDTANTLFVLRLSDRISSEEAPTAFESVLKFYHDGYFITYVGESTASISSNINWVNALHLVANSPKDLVLPDNQGTIKYQGIIENVSTWLVTEITKCGYNTVDKWHASHYYPLTRAVFAFCNSDDPIGQRPDISDQIYGYLLANQNDDGGWGCGRSSAIETAMVIISVAYWWNFKYKELDDLALSALRKGRDFLSGNNKADDKFWLAKELFSVINLDKLVVLAAQYRLSKIKF